MKKRSDVKNASIEESFISEVKNIVEQGRQQAYVSVSQLMIETYWRIGERIVLQEQQGKERADYGTQLISQLSEELTRTFGKGFSKRNLQYFRSFYLNYNDLGIVQSRLHNITWTHILKTLRVEDPVAYSETELEGAIITHLREFIMEMGRGFAFMGRQELIRTANNDYFIDLVFYNVVLKCYVLIDLKLGKISSVTTNQINSYICGY